MEFGPGQILAIVLVVYSIILHEIAHGYAALKFGDETAKINDRLTLNPLHHIDPIGTILLPLVLYFSHAPILGWAKPVPVNPHNLEPRTAGEVVVAIAGVTVNLAIAVAMAIVMGFVFRSEALYETLRSVLVANVALAVFNLVPIPPLDGSHVLEKILPYDLRESYRRIGFYGIFILFALMTTGVLGRVISPPIVAIANFLLKNITLRIVAGMA